MTPSTGRTTPSSQEVLAWVCQRSVAPRACSISLCTHRALDLDDLGAQLANYLNEFDPDSLGSWRTFDGQLIRQAAGDPHLRQAIQSASQGLADTEEEAPDFDQTAAGLGALGHAILEGEASLTATQDNPKVFKVCLDCQPSGPQNERTCDLWINAPRFNPRAQVTSIGDAFLEWLSRH
jgi:hypothetical protein